MKISIGKRSRRTRLQKSYCSVLEQKGHTITNHGTDTFDSVDYPDFGHKVATDVAEGKSGFWYHHLRKRKRECDVCQQTPRNSCCFMLDKRKIATLARQHNDANI